MYVCNSAYVLSKLILKVSEDMKLCFPLKLFTRYKAFRAQSGGFERFGGLWVDSYYTLREGVKGGKLIIFLPLQHQAGFHPKI